MKRLYALNSDNTLTPTALDHETLLAVACRLPSSILSSDVKHWGLHATPGDMFIIDSGTALVCLDIERGNRSPGPVNAKAAPAEEKVVMAKPIEEPSISVDRQARSIAIFDNDFDLIRDFENYTNEEEGLAKAKLWLKARTDKEPKMVYPSITRAVFSRGRGKR